MKTNAVDGAEFYDKSVFVFQAAVDVLSADPLPVIPTLVFDGTFAKQMVRFFGKSTVSRLSSRLSEVLMF